MSEANQQADASTGIKCIASNGRDNGLVPGHLRNLSAEARIKNNVPAGWDENQCPLI